MNKTNGFPNGHADCCGSKTEGEERVSAFDLVVIGGGSAAFAAAIKTSELGGKTAIINDGLPIGGTCVNVGCVPSKSLIRAAEAHHKSLNHSFAGITSSSVVSDFSKVTEQTQSLIDQLRVEKYVNVVADDANIRIVEGRASISDPHTVLVGSETFRTKNILIATGATTHVPSIQGLNEIEYLTNESAYQLQELPDHLIVFGGRYIALENAQMFARLGAKVTILQRSSRILPDQDEDVSEEIAKHLGQEGIRILTDVAIESVAQDNDGISVQITQGSDNLRINGSHVFLGTGREGNTIGLGLEMLGIETHGNGYLAVDETLRTSVENIFGAGDVIGEYQFVYTAAYEGNLAAENASFNMHKSRDYTALPWVVFTDPQVAGVGLDEGQARSAGIDYEVTTLDLKYIPRSLAARDTRGFIKLLRDVSTDALIGARIVAPEGSELLMELSLAIKHGITVTELKEAFHPYLTLSEGIKLAAISFGKDVGKLSCCAV